MLEGALEPEEDRVFTRGNSRKDKDALPGRNNAMAKEGDEEDDDEEDESEEECSGE